jgi:hypothetical protein
LIFARDPQRSHLSPQECELELGDNIFIIHPSSNHNYKNFTVGSYQVKSGQVSGYLVSGHFGYRVISGQVGSGIESSSVGSFHILRRIRSGPRVSSHLISGHFSFWVVSGRVSDHLVLDHFTSGQVRSGFESFSVGLFWIMNCIGLRRVGQISQVGSGFVTSILYAFIIIDRSVF